MSPIIALVVAVVALVSSVLVFIRLRAVDGSLGKTDMRLSAMQSELATLRSSVETLSAQRTRAAISSAPPSTAVSHDVVLTHPQPIDRSVSDSAPGAPLTPSPPQRVFAPTVTPSEVDATSQALSGEANRAHALADLLRGVEQISGGTNVAVTRLASIENEALQERRVADQTMDYLKLADRDPDQAALRKDAIEAAYRNLGQDPAGPVAAKIDAVIADHVTGVLTALWQRTQDDSGSRDVLNQLCKCCDVTLIEPRPGDPNDPDGFEVSDRVDGGNPDRISRTVVPGIVLHGRRIRKPLVKVFKGS